MTSRNRRSGPSISTWVGLVFLVLFVGVVALWRTSVTSLVWSALSPVMSLRNALHSSEVDTLRAELASTTAALADRDVLYKENLDLKSRLLRNAERHVVLAGVVSRPAGTPYDTLVVDAGASQGISKGQLVAAAGSTLIGRIDEVYSSSARVALFSSPGTEYTALLNNTTPLSIAGQGGGSMQGSVPIGTKVAVGDPLVLMGIGEGLVGTVSALGAKEGQSFITVYLQLPANPQELRFVEIWK